MVNLEARLPSLKEPPDASTVASRTRENKVAHLLELRTEQGPVYLQPSRWQRMRLHWTFRNFHVLPPQVLSRQDQRLIEKLAQSAVVTPALPVRSNAVLGVIEKVRAKSPASANRVFTLKPELAATHAAPVKKQRETSEAAPASTSHGMRAKQWGALSALAAVCAGVMLTAFLGRPLSSSTRQMKDLPATPIKVAENRTKLPDLVAIASTTAVLETTEKPRHWVAPSPAPAPADQEPTASVLLPSISPVSHSAVPALTPDTIPALVGTDPSAEPRFVAELPQGYFAHPLVSEPNLEGELQLKALIGADGSVKGVTVLSGDPKLAAAGMRAVRQWRYKPYQVLGSPVEVETQIKMRFFGQDAVSIASVGHESASAIK